MREVAEGLGPRELDTLVAFAEFLKARRAARGFAHHYEHQLQERESRRHLETSPILDLEADRESTPSLRDGGEK